MDIEKLYTLFEQHPTIGTDSRQDGRGGIFFALRGEHFDGNRYVDKALETHSYAVVDDPAAATSDRCLLVADTLQALQALAAEHRRRHPIPLIAITGTNGKTTTKELVAAVLGRKFRTYATRGNLNNHIGVPLSVLEITPRHQMAVIEMGASGLGEIRALCQIAQPDYGIVTNIGKAHLETFGSYANVIKAKCELFDYLEAHKGTAFVNDDDELMEDVALPRATVLYGTRRYAHCYGEPLESGMQVSFQWFSNDEDLSAFSCVHRVDTRLVGGYNFYNAMAAVCVGNHFEVPGDDIDAALDGYVPRNNRSQLLDTGRNRVVVDCYNANPSSMRAAVENFAALPGDDKMLILGEMLELGAMSEREHEIVCRQVAAAGVGQAWLVGPDFAPSAPPFALHFADTDQLVEHLRQNRPSGKLILVKGSRGMRLERVLELL